MMSHRFLAVVCLSSASALVGQTIEPLTGVEGQSLNRQVLESRSTRNTKVTGKQVAVFPGDTVIPHIVDGGAWSTAITLTNLDTRTLTVRVLFFRDNGTDLLLPVVGQGVVRGMNITLDPTTTLTFETAGVAGTTSSGWASIVKTDTEDAVGGIAVFRQRVSGRPDFEAVIPVVNRFDDRGVLIFDNTNGFVTAAAFANPNPTVASIQFAVRAENGSVLERKTITFDPFTHSAGTIPATFPSTVGRRGSIEFTILDSFGVGVLGVRFNPSGAFTTFHVLSNINWLLD